MELRRILRENRGYLEAHRDVYKRQILGVFIMSVLQTGLPLIGLQANYQQIIIGLVLIVAVYIDVLKNKKLDK